VFDKKLLGPAFTDQLVRKTANDPQFRFPFLMPGIFCQFLGHEGKQAQIPPVDERNCCAVTGFLRQLLAF